MSLQNTDLFPGVGDNSRVDHVAIQVDFLALDRATDLFKGLGFHEDKSRRQRGDWGEARFFTKDGSIPIQLTEPSVDDNHVDYHETHVAIAVEDPETVFTAIETWAVHHGREVTKENAKGGKIFVFLSDLLAVPIELVPASN